MGRLQVVTGLSDQLHRNAWSVLGEFWWEGGRSRSHYNSGCHGPGLFPRWTIISGFVVPFFQSGYYSYARDISTTLMLGL